MKKLLITIFLSALILVGCSKDTSDNETNVTVSVYPIGKIVEQLAGDLVNVNYIYPAGADIHNYEPTSQDMVNITGSDLVIYISDEEEPFINNLKIDDDQTTYVSLLNDHEKDEDHEEEVEHNHDHDDPHLWLSPHHLIELSNDIAEELKELLPQSVDLIDSNLSQLIEELTLQDQAYTTFGEEQTKPIVVSHEAYGYLEDDYSIEFVNLYGKFHDDEPTSAEISEVIDLIKEDNISYIFSDENSINSNLMAQIATESNSKVDTLLTMSTSSDISKDMTLDEMLTYNLEQMEISQ